MAFLDHGDGAAKQILVVDPDNGSREQLHRALALGGYSVVAATTLAHAACFAREEQFDAALVSGQPGEVLPFLALLSDLQPSCLRLLVTEATHADALVPLLNQGDVVRVIAKPLVDAAILAAVNAAFQAARRIEAAATERMIESHRQERRWFDEMLTEGLLRLALQPIVHFRGETFEVIAYEALLRTQHPAWPLPSAAIVVAERLGRVSDLGAAVFRLAAALLPSLPARQRLFVNLHPAQLEQPDRLLADLAPLVPWATRVTLELTERAHPLAVDNWEPAIERLAALGFGLAIDDLGAGSSGFLMLASLQPQVIKLDMTLVRGIAGSARKRRLIQLLVTFAETTGAHLLAEGVETEEEVVALRSCGVALMQGFRFGRPTLERPLPTEP